MSDSKHVPGFTLIEILAAVFILTVILTLVTGLFIENGRQRKAALDLMAERLTASGALSMMEQDLAATVFVAKKEDQRPDQHPWRFFAEDSDEHGSTALRFVTQNAPSGSRAEHGSGWVEVAYFLEEDESGENVLWRWLSARPPAAAPRGFPDADEPGAMRIAVGVSAFGVRWLGPLGEWLDDWDSTDQSPVDAIPRAAEISLALQRDARIGETEDGSLRVPGPLHTRRVGMPMGVIDVVKLIELGREDDDEELACFTIQECLEEGDSAWYSAALNEDCDGDDELCEMLEDPENACFSDLESDFPGVAGQAPDECAS